MSKIYQTFREQAAKRSTENAIVSRGEGLRLSFSDVTTRIDEWREQLRGLPAGPVALATGNCAAFFEIFLALRALDRAVLTMDATGSLGERVESAQTLGCSALLVRFSESAGGPSLPPTAVPVGGPDGMVAWLDIRTSEPRVSVPEGTALIKMTSGSTGCPSGVCLDEASLLAGIRQIGEGMNLQSEDRVLIAIPLSHSYGFDNGILSLAVLGTALILESPSYLSSLLQTLVEEGATFFPTVPPLVHFLSETEWPRKHCLHTVICAGGRLDPAVAERFRQKTGLPVHQFYGSTETGGITYESAPLSPEAAGTVGHPLPGVTLRLTERGQVEVHSAANRGGMAGDSLPLESRPVLVEDLAEWTPEGRLRIVGRASDFVNVSGRRLSIPAIEASLLSLDGVEEVAVLATTDPIRGERLAAFVVGSQERLDPVDLPTGLNSRDIHHLEGLPYTERGKVDRKSLSRLAGGVS